MTNQEVLFAIGAGCIGIGLLWVWVGDKEIPVKGGVILKTFSAKPGQMRWMKWLMGGGLVFVGVMFIKRGLEPA